LGEVPLPVLLVAAASGILALLVEDTAALRLRYFWREPNDASFYQLGPFFGC